MPILFSVVACEKDMVSHFASCEGNFMEIAEQVLTKIPQCDKKMTYSHGTYLLHYIAEDSYVYFCITDKLCQRSRTFLFLNEIQRQFIANKERTKEDFTEVLAAEMYRYSEDYSTITIRNGELDELNKIGVGCSEDLLGEKILYINNPDNISYSTISYMASTPGHTSYVSSIAEPTSHEDNASEEISYASSITKPVSYIDSTAEQIPNENSTLEQTSLDNPTYEEVLENNNIEPIATEDNISSLEQVSYVNQTPEQRPQVANIPAELSYVENDSEQITISPRLYIVIIGMALIVIALAIYMFGPISCAVVTSIGVYSLYRLRVNKEDKSD